MSLELIDLRIQYEHARTIDFVNESKCIAELYWSFLKGFETGKVKRCNIVVSDNWGDQLHHYSNWSDLNWSYIDSQTSFNDTCYYLSTDKESLEINLYPNPISTYFNVELNENTNYKIVNLNGQVIKSGHLFAGKNTLFVEELNAGVYFVVLESDGYETVKKISVL